jgi:golgi-specific brefeldin A-resistance guanine nucleotide exchange factor 1
VATNKLCQEHGYVNVPFLLHTISGFPKEIVGKTASLVLLGLKGCTDEPGPLRSEMMTSPDFWAILRTLAGRSGSAPVVFGILERGTTGSPSSIMADNYEAAIALLNEFATAAGRSIVITEKPQDPKQKKSRTAKRESKTT